MGWASSLWTRGPLGGEANREDGLGKERNFNNERTLMSKNSYQVVVQGYLELLATLPNFDKDFAKGDYGQNLGEHSGRKKFQKKRHPYCLRSFVIEGNRRRLLLQNRIQVYQ